MAFGPGVDCAKALDKHYIPARYPKGFEEGAPMDYYTPAEAEKSIADANSVIIFCEDIYSVLDRLKSQARPSVVDR